ncbi:MAG TPA: GAF domain-containing protein, partial [Anaerolineaceae bacterium]|nr:GAF domain-containing protein [Anaerolineaceae bacterium]
MIPHVTRTGETLLANDIQQQPLFRPFDGSTQDTRSELTIPLKFGTEVLGVLDIQSTDTNGFGENEIEIFESLASSVALAIRNATLYRTEQWRRQVADSFREVSHLLSAG